MAHANSSPPNDASRARWEANSQRGTSTGTKGRPVHRGGGELADEPHDNTREALVRRQQVRAEPNHGERKPLGVGKLERRSYLLIARGLDEVACWPAGSKRCLAGQENVLDHASRSRMSAIA